MPRGRAERMRRAQNISVQTTANSSAVNDLINFAAPSDWIPAVANDGSDFPRKSNENFKPFPFVGEIRCKKATSWRGEGGGGRQILLSSSPLLRSSETAAFAECLLNTEGAGLYPPLFLLNGPKFFAHCYQEDGYYPCAKVSVTNISRSIKSEVVVRYEIKTRHPKLLVSSI